ncbi:MAG: DinB family protein [Gemmatimonadota bacterium]|nr:DinB family protein [Gemmatimonadota bacterium]
MAMEYEHVFIPSSALPPTRLPLLRHLVETYASETSKTAGVWSELSDAQLEFRPHARSSTVRQILVHQLLSERRFFAEFIGLPEPPVESVLPAGESPGVATYVERYVALATSRLAPLAQGDEGFWLAEVPFFDVRRERIWVFWRRVLHTAHHRAQLGLCLRLLEGRVPPVYGPTADVTWTGADPTVTLDAARRRGT